MNTISQCSDPFKTPDNKEVIGSSWMDLHEDEYYIDEDGCYTIKIVEVGHKDACLIHTVEGEFKKYIPVVGEVFKFIATEPHGLLPTPLVDAIINKEIDVQLLYKISYLFNVEVDDPVMLWEWIDGGE